ncbi:MAG: hypothetical protein HRF50_17200 [Phycisphaerae bacterium]
MVSPRVIEWQSLAKPGAAAIDLRRLARRSAGPADPARAQPGATSVVHARGLGEYAEWDR